SPHPVIHGLVPWIPVAAGSPPPDDAARPTRDRSLSARRERDPRNKSEDDGVRVGRWGLGRACAIRSGPGRGGALAGSSCFVAQLLPTIPPPHPVIHGLVPWIPGAAGSPPPDDAARPTRDRSLNARRERDPRNKSKDDGAGWGEPAPVGGKGG